MIPEEQTERDALQWLVEKRKRVATGEARLYGSPELTEAEQQAVAEKIRARWLADLDATIEGVLRKQNAKPGA